MHLSEDCMIPSSKVIYTELVQKIESTSKLLQHFNIDSYQNHEQGGNLMRSNCVDALLTE